MSAGGPQAAQAHRSLHGRSRSCGTSPRSGDEKPPTQPPWRFPARPPSHLCGGPPRNSCPPICWSFKAKLVMLRVRSWVQEGGWGVGDACVGVGKEGDAAEMFPQRTDCELQRRSLARGRHRKRQKHAPVRGERAARSRLPRGRILARLFRQRTWTLVLNASEAPPMCWLNGLMWSVVGNTRADSHTWGAARTRADRCVHRELAQGEAALIYMAPRPPFASATSAKHREQTAPEGQPPAPRSHPATIPGLLIAPRRWPPGS